MSALCQKQTWDYIQATPMIAPKGILSTCFTNRFDNQPPRRPRSAAPMAGCTPGAVGYARLATAL
jgi:hypothetical protein